MEINQRIGANIRTLRKGSGLSQEELANVLNYSYKTISDIERGIIQVKVDTLIQLSQYFNVSMDDIVKTNIKARSQVIHYNELPPSELEYKKYNGGCFYLYHYRTNDKCRDVLEKGSLSVAMDAERSVHTVEAVFYKDSHKKEESLYNGTLVISGVHTYIYINGRFNKDRALIVFYDPQSYKPYIGGIGLALSSSEGYKNSKPCFQGILLSSMDIPQEGLGRVEQFLKLFSQGNESFFKLDKAIDESVYQFLKQYQSRA